MKHGFIFLNHVIHCHASRCRRRSNTTSPLPPSPLLLFSSTPEDSFIMFKYLEGAQWCACFTIIIELNCSHFKLKLLSYIVFAFYVVDYYSEKEKKMKR